MTLTWIDLTLIAAVVVPAYAVALVAITRSRRDASRHGERVITLIGALDERLEGLSERQAYMDTRLNDLSRRLDVPARAPSTPSLASPSYPIAIRLARSGASCEQLMESCGLGRQEAELVRRLHGPAKRASRSRNAAA
jgi:hypothetical protein